MEKVHAFIELTSILFKCGVIVAVGLYALSRYRNYLDNKRLTSLQN